MADLYQLSTVILTRGERGSLIFRDDEWFDHPGVPTEVVDTVGAGDAFTAAVTLGLLARLEPRGHLQRGQRTGRLRLHAARRHTRPARKISRAVRHGHGRMRAVWDVPPGDFGSAAARQARCPDRIAKHGSAAASAAVARVSGQVAICFQTPLHRDEHGGGIPRRAGSVEARWRNPPAELAP